MTKLVKKPWNEGAEARHGTKTSREYAAWGAASLTANGSGSKRTNMAVMVDLTRRRYKKAVKAAKPAGRMQRAVKRYIEEA